MRRFFVLKENINGNFITIDGGDFSHLKNVLRLKENDKVVCICGDGKHYFCYIEKIELSKAICKIEKIEIAKTSPKTNVVLFQPLLKNENFELVIQKLTELGIKKIIPFESSFAVSKWKEEKLARFNKIAVEASKQCGRAEFLEVERQITFKSLLQKIKEFDLVIFAWEKANENNSLKQILSQNQNLKNIGLIIGSEGGFSENEANSLIEAGAKPVWLGERILRAETASIAVASVLMYTCGEWEN